MLTGADGDKCDSAHANGYFKLETHRSDIWWRLSLLFQWKEELVSACAEGLSRHLYYASENWRCMRRLKAFLDAVTTGIFFPYLPWLQQHRVVREPKGRNHLPLSDLSMTSQSHQEWNSDELQNIKPLNLLEHEPGIYLVEGARQALVATFGIIAPWLWEELTEVARAPRGLVESRRLGVSSSSHAGT